MNKGEAKESWEEQKTKLKERFKFLTDSDLIFDENHKAAMLKRLETKLGTTKEELQKIIGDFK